MASTRNQVVKLQKATLRTIKDRIFEHIGELPNDLKRFQADYHKATATYSAISTRDELTKRICDANIVLCGDFHTLNQAQRVHLRLLRDQLKKNRQIVLGVEVIPASEQDNLDRFMAGTLTEKAFLKAIDYKRIWGFPWEHYRPIFEFAQKNQIPMFGLNTNTGKGGVHPTLSERDNFVAKKIATITKLQPNSLLFVTFGDMHLAPHHIPAKLDKALGKEERKTLVVYQNSEALYWQLAEQGLADKVDVVRVDDRSYCIIGAPPWVKQQSYLDWLENTDRQLMSGASYQDSVKANYEEELYNIACEISVFLGLEKYGLESFDFRTIDDLPKIQNWYPNLSHLVTRNNCLYFPDRNLIFLTIVDINHAAEGAAELIHHLRSGFGDDDPTTKDAFYRRIMRRAMAYFGSMLLNHKRKCWYFRDHHLFVQKTKGKHLSREDKEKRLVSQKVLEHQRAEDEFIWGLKQRLHLPSVYKTDIETGYAISRAIGYIQGDKFYRGLFQRVVTGKDMRQLFLNPMEEPGEAQEVYIHWRIVLKQVFKMFTSKDQTF